VTPTTANTLYLNDIVTENGVPRAVLMLNGTTYRLAAGERIPGTPWQVLRIGTTQVTMLYGDTQVTLSVGQGKAK
jgi:type IV pilus biogenesis protein PilP